MSLPRNVVDSEANGVSDGTDVATRPSVELFALTLGVHQLALDALTQLGRTLNFDSLNCREVLSLTALKVQLGYYLVQCVAQLHLVVDCGLQLTLVLLGI